MRLSKTIAGAAVCAALAAAPLRAADDPGTTGAPILQIPLGSRALGMGSAFTPVASDVSALYYNPAGLSRLNAHELAFTYIAGISDNHIQHLAYGGPLPFTGISGNGYSGFGTSLLFAQQGSIEVNRTSPDGSFLNSERLSAGGDFVATLGYAERVGTTPLELRDGRNYGVNHFLGISGKFLRSTLVEAYSAETFTADAGYLINSPEAGLTFGMSALNLGGRMKYVDASDPLPTTLRAGVAYQGGLQAQHNMTFAADTEYLATERQFHVNAGAEYFWQRSYGLRFGYQFMRDSLGLTIGFGLRWRARVLVDYAWAMSRALSDAHRFTFSYRFGGVALPSRARQRRPFIERAPDRETFEGLEDKRPSSGDEPPAPPRNASPRPARAPTAPGWIY